MEGVNKFQDLILRQLFRQHLRIGTVHYFPVKATLRDGVVMRVFHSILIFENKRKAILCDSGKNNYEDVKVLLRFGVLKNSDSGVQTNSVFEIETTAFRAFRVEISDEYAQGFSDAIERSLLGLNIAEPGDTLTAVESIMDVNTFTTGEIVLMRAIVRDPKHVDFKPLDHTVIVLLPDLMCCYIVVPGQRCCLITPLRVLDHDRERVQLILHPDGQHLFVSPFDTHEFEDMFVKLKSTIPHPINAILLKTINNTRRPIAIREGIVGIEH